MLTTTVTGITLILLSNVHPSTAQDETVLTILHNNDFHSDFEESDDGIGGVARMITYVKSYKSSRPNSIYLNGGNFFTGSLLFIVFQAEIVVKFVNLMQFDAMVFGYDEFFAGKEQLIKYYTGVTAPLLCVNCVFSGLPNVTEKVKPSVILNTKDKKVGVVGYMSTVLNAVAPDKQIVKVLDEIPKIQQEVNNLKEQGAEIIIALGHGNLTLHRWVAEQVTGIHAVVCGFNTSFLYTGDPPISQLPVGKYPIIIEKKKDDGDKEPEQIPIIHTTQGSKFVGKLKMTFFNEKVILINGNPFYMDGSVTPDASAVQELSTYLKSTDKLKKESVGSTKVYLSTEDCIKRECNFGNLMADAYVEYKMHQYNHPTHWTDTAIGIFMGALMDKAINPQVSGENISYKQVMEAVTPIEGSAVTISLNGSGLRTAVEHSVAHAERENKLFLQYSGIRVKYDFTKPSYKRIIDMKVRCAECDIPRYDDVKPEKLYRMIVTDHVASGQYGHSVFKEGLDFVQEKLTNNQFLKEYLLSCGPVMIGAEERIIINEPVVEESVGHLLRTSVTHIICKILLVYILLY